MRESYAVRTKEAICMSMAFAVLGNMSAALDIGLWANVLETETSVYYADERAWAGIDVEVVWSVFTSDMCSGY